jgi:hypothetical protein
VDRLEYGVTVLETCSYLTVAATTRLKCLLYQLTPLKPLLESMELIMLQEMVEVLHQPLLLALKMFGAIRMAFIFS